MRHWRKLFILTLYIAAVPGYLFLPNGSIRHSTAQYLSRPVFQAEINSTQSEKLDASGVDMTQPFNILWEIKADNIKTITVASDNEADFILTTFDGKVFSVNAVTGLINWATELGGRTVSKPFIEAGNLYVVTKSVAEDELVKTPSKENAENNSQLESKNSIESRKNNTPEHRIVRSINIKTGLTNWQVKTATVENFENAFLHVYQSALIVLENGGNLTFFDKQTGEPFEQRENIGFSFSAEPVFSDDTIIVAAAVGPIAFISINARKTVFEINPNEIVTAVNYVERSKTFVWGSHRGTVSSTVLDFNRPSSSIASKVKSTVKTAWKFRQGAEISDISLTSRGFLVSSFDNFLCLISEKDGSLRWKKRVGGRIVTKPLIYGEYIVITNTAESTASIVELKTGRTVNKITLPADTVFINQPLIAGGKILLTTQNGIYAFGSAAVGK